MSQVELLELVMKVLGQLGIESMLVGSHASSFYGEARSTHDIDIVIDLDPDKIDSLVSSFDSQRYYLSPQSLREGRMANLIDTKSGDKVDFFLLQRNEKSELEFSRRRQATILGVPTSIASPEDTVLSKLEWNRQVGGSDRQLSDVREILRHRGSTLDTDYMHAELESRQLLDSFQAQFGDLQ